MKTALTGLEGGVFDPRRPDESKYKRDPERDYKAFMQDIPRKEDIKSLKDHEVDAGYVTEMTDCALGETEKLKKNLISISGTFQVIEGKKLIPKVNNVLKLFEKKPFELDAVKSGIVLLMEVEGELMYSLAIFGGSQAIQHGNARAAKRAFVRLLEMY